MIIKRREITTDHIYEALGKYVREICEPPIAKDMPDTRLGWMIGDLANRALSARQLIESADMQLDKALDWYEEFIHANEA